MPSDGRSTAIRRDLMLVLTAVCLFAAPLLVTAYNVGEPTYRYERVEVTTNEATIEYAKDPAFPIEHPISDEIACSRYVGSRSCALERMLLNNRTVPTRGYSSDLDLTHPSTIEERYRYVRLNGVLYATTYVANESVQGEYGMYRTELALERADPDQALDSVSRPVTSDDLPRAVTAAARDGEASASRKAIVPETPIQLENEAYYRVYLAEQDDPSFEARSVRLLLTYIPPLFGLLLTALLLAHIDITYVGDKHHK